jgi:hypothetical protein
MLFEPMLNVCVDVLIYLSRSFGRDSVGLALFLLG